MEDPHTEGKMRVAVRVVETEEYGLVEHKPARKCPRFEAWVGLVWSREIVSRQTGHGERYRDGRLEHEDRDTHSA